MLSLSSISIVPSILPVSNSSSSSFLSLCHPLSVTLSLTFLSLSLSIYLSIFYPVSLVGSLSFSLSLPLAIHSLTLNACVCTHLTCLIYWVYTSTSLHLTHVLITYVRTVDDAFLLFYLSIIMEEYKIS